MGVAGITSPSIDSAVAVFSVLTLSSVFVEFVECIDSVDAGILAVLFSSIYFIQNNGHLASSQNGCVLVESVDGVTNSQAVVVNVGIISSELLITGHVCLSEVVIFSSGC